jgi:hypothetical protein
VGTRLYYTSTKNFHLCICVFVYQLRNVNTGGLEVYDIANNQLSGAAFIGDVGLEWQSRCPGPRRRRIRSSVAQRQHRRIRSLRHRQQSTDWRRIAVGSDWQLGGFAAAPPSGSMSSSGSSSQLVQAMADFGGGSGADLAADTSPQSFLATPQHA